MRVRIKQLFFSFLILVCVGTISLIHKLSLTSSIINKTILYVGSSDNNAFNQRHSSVGEIECRIPQLDPYDKSIKHLLKDKSSISYANCETLEYPFLFNSTFESTIVPQKEESYFREVLQIHTCCYKTVERNYFAWDPDNSIAYGNECFPLSLTKATVIPSEHEFIVIHCRKRGTANQFVANEFSKVFDVHAFVPLKPEVEKRIASLPKEVQDRKKYNVVIFGLDAVSRMNFLRTMQDSHSYLMNNLSAVEMTGYNKVGENTFPNLAPLLTSKTGENLKRICLVFRWLNGYDGCPFIWKDFAKNGYYTSYAEDLPGVAAFNFRNSGFRKQPTDYYPRAFVKSAVETVATNMRISAYDCYGPRIPFTVWLDYMKKIFYTMRKNERNFFHFSWSTSLTHDDLHTSFLGDKALLETMQWLKEFDYLNDTIFILLSDHGHRIHSIRQTLQGQYEDRLPLMYFLVPESFKQDYDQAYRNLLLNSDKLITTFDLHETLKDILTLSNIAKSSLRERTWELSLLESVNKFPRGISLFLPISKFRTCETAGIEINFCSCLNLKFEFTNNTRVTDMAGKVVSHINTILEGYSECAKLHLENVTMVQYTGTEKHSFEAYFLNFRTDPGGGLFEAVISRKIGPKEWKITGPITRTNSYKDQSHCVEDAGVKPYCICVN